MNLCDHKFLTVAKKYGEWPKVLDPVFSPPEQLYVDLEAAGYSREDFARLRARENKPERDTWIKTIAFYLYWMWRRKLDHLDHASFLKMAPGFDNENNWLDITAFLGRSSVYPIKESPFFVRHAGVMKKLLITNEDIVRRITEDTERFPPLVAPPCNLETL